MLEIEMKTISSQHKNLFESSLSALGSWGKFLFGVDGRDHQGKSTTARFLAWQIGMSLIETDLFRVEDATGRTIDSSTLKQIINRRLGLDRPVIVEGIYLLRHLKDIGLEPDFLIYVESKTNGSSYGFKNTLGHRGAGCALDDFYANAR